MTDSARKYLSLIAELIRLVKASKKRCLLAKPDKIIARNLNFFTKSYLVMLCVYLESYIKEIAAIYVSFCNQNIKRAKVPSNIISWNMRPSEKVDKKIISYSDYCLTITNDNIDEFVSANPHRISDMFCMLGIDYEHDKKLVRWKNIIWPIVDKRNKIIHHNDTASDQTFDDVLCAADSFKRFIKDIDAKISAEMNKRQERS